MSVYLWVAGKPVDSPSFENLKGVITAFFEAVYSFPFQPNRLI
jgi:hypothetical protein